MQRNMQQFWEHYEVVLFDCDDTLTMSMQVRIKAILHMADQLHVSLNEKQIRAAWGLPFDTFVNTIMPGVELQTYVDLFRTIHDQYQAIPQPGVRQLIEFLTSQQKHLEIVTSSKQEIILKDLTTIGIRDHFVEIWGNEQTAPYGKPDPRVLTPLLARLETKHDHLSQFVYIGDSLGDYQIAAGNALDFIAVTTGLHSRRDFVKAGVHPSHIKRSLAELIPTDHREREHRLAVKEEAK